VDQPGTRDAAPGNIDLVTSQEAQPDRRRSAAIVDESQQIAFEV